MNLTTILLFLLLSVSQGAVLINKQIGANCTSSYECGTGDCCRDASGLLVDGSRNPEGPFGSIGNEDISRHGICSSRRGLKGEVCDSNCGCDKGLECYRPVTGFCCPPMTCYDAAYVKKQREYWRKCFSNPQCQLPP